LALCAFSASNLQRHDSLRQLILAQLTHLNSFSHFLTKTLPKVAAEMALSVLAYNLIRAMNIVGTKPLITALSARAITEIGAFDSVGTRSPPTGGNMDLYSDFAVINLSSGDSLSLGWV
jgi:hypothetical protein